MLFKRRDDDNLEEALRRERPQARKEFVQRMTARMSAAPRSRSFSPRRLALSSGFTVLVLAGIAATGGVSYAAHIVAESTSVLTTHVFHISAAQKPTVHVATPALDQYGNGGDNGNGNGGQNNGKGNCGTDNGKGNQGGTNPGNNGNGNGNGPGGNGNGQGGNGKCTVNVAGLGTVVVSSSANGDSPTVTQTPGGATITGTSSDDQIVSNVGNLIVNDLAGNNTIAIAGAGNTVHTGPGNDLIALGKGDQTVDAGDGNNNIHVYGTTGTHKITVGNGNQIIRLYGGTNTINATGTGSKDIHVTGGTGTITATNGGATIFTKKGSSYTINVKNGAKDQVNCNGAKDTVISDAGLDTLINCPK